MYMYISNTCLVVAVVSSIVNDVHVLYKMIYWQGIYIDNWQFYAEIVNIKFVN